jgi:hypothetical protein
MFGEPDERVRSEMTPVDTRDVSRPRPPPPAGGVLAVDDAGVVTVVAQDARL